MCVCVCLIVCVCVCVCVCVMIFMDSGIIIIYPVNCTTLQTHKQQVGISTSWSAINYKQFGFFLGAATRRYFFGASLWSWKRVAWGYRANQVINRDCVCVFVSLPMETAKNGTLRTFLIFR